MIISCLTLKGGGGKTTIAVNLAVAFSLKKKKVMLIDTDGQQTASDWADERPEGKATISVVAMPKPEQLRKQIVNFQDYDVIIIDGTPAIGRMATVSAALSDLVIMPVAPSAFDQWATGEIMERMEEVQETAPEMKTAIIANKITPRSNQSKKLFDMLNEIEGHHVFKQSMGYRVSYSDSAAEGLGVMEWSDDKAKTEIANLVKEINKLMKGK